MSDPTTQPDFDDELLSAYLDDELAPEQRALVEARLASDPAARQMLDELRHVSETLRNLPQQAMPADARESVVRRAVEARDAAPATAGDAVLAPPSFTIGRTRRGWFWASLAVAAGLVIMFVQREPLEEEGISVAHRRDRAPSLSAVPKSSPRDETQPAADRLIESESAVPSATVAEGSSRALDETVDRFAAEAPAPPAAAADENQLVVVHVLAKREALENNAFERLLVSNGVRFDPAERGRAVRRSRAVRSRVGGEVTAAPADAVEEEEVDVLLVEASPPTILSCLEELNNDHANYLSVSVDESAPDGEHEPNTVTLGAKVAPPKKLAVDLGKYNRGVVTPRQKALFAPNKAQYFEQAAEGQFAGRGGAADALSDGEPEARFQFRHEDKALEGRAQRLFVANSKDRRLEELRKLAIPSQAPVATDANKLQVLFVLAPGEEPAAASPAAENRAE